MHFSSESIFGQLFIDIKRLLLKSLCFLHTTPFHVQFGENFPKFQKAKTYVMKTKHLPGKNQITEAPEKILFMLPEGPGRIISSTFYSTPPIVKTKICHSRAANFSKFYDSNVVDLFLKQNLNDLFRPLCLHILAIWICSVWLKMLVMLSKRQSNSHWANLNCRKWSNKHSRQLA